MAGTTNSVANAMPRLNSALVDLPSGNVSIPWYRLFIALWNRTGGNAGTVTVVLDSIGSDQGDLLFRAATEWAALPAGTAGFALKTGGAGADPFWSAVVSEVDTGNGLVGGPITASGTIALAPMAALTVKGNASASVGPASDLDEPTVKTMLGYVASGDPAGGDLTGTYPNPTIVVNAVGNTKLAQMPADTLKGNNTGALANASDLTVAQVLTMLGLSPAPAMPNFLAYLSASQVLASSTLTKIPFDVKTIDAGNYYDNVTNFRYLPLVAGTYFVTLKVHAGAVGLTSLSIQILKNGTSIAQGAGNFAAISANESAEISFLVVMNGATDYLEGWVSVSGASGWTVIGNVGPTLTYFTAHRIGP